MKKIALLLCFTVAVFAQAASASVVKIQAGSVFNTSHWNSYYNSLAGVTSTTLSAGDTLSATTFAGTDLFIAATPTNAYSAGEATAISDFLNAGGRMFMMGEHSGFSTNNTYVNNLLSAIGATMSIVGAFNDCGAQIANAAQVGGSVLTVAGMSYGCSSTTINGGTTELLAKDLTTVLMASNNFGSGRITIIGDGNVGLNQNSMDNQFFLNLLNGPTTVPAPFALLTFGMGLIGFGFARKKA